ncbi:MAG: energy-coupling factor transporter transmembrane component T family protein [Roseiflexaceae bacterium]
MQFAIQYLRKDSIMHRMDAITKLIWIFVIGIYGFVLGSPPLLGISVLLVILTGLVLGRIPASLFLRVSGYLWILGLAVGVGQLIIRKGGAVLLPIPLVPVTEQGLEWALRFAFRIMLIAYASMVYVWTTDPRKLVLGLIHLGVPYRFGYGLFVALRFMPLMENEAEVIRQALTVRSVAEVSGRLEAMRRYALPLLVAGIRRSENVAITMDSRAFGAYPSRTYVEMFKWTVSGVALVLAYLFLGAVLIYIGLQTGGLFQRI